MNKDDSGAGRAAGAGAQALPPWSECDVFCIRGYAGGNGSRCGWRGRLQPARRGEESELVCPRCGGVTLLRIPPSLWEPT